MPLYAWKDIPGSSHRRLVARLRELPPGGSMLDLGAAGGFLGSAVRPHFRRIAGVEEAPSSPPPGYDLWLTASLAEPVALDERFDVVVAADVLEHLARPEALLARIRDWIAPGGRLLASVPNVANIAVRALLLAGRFPYAEKGILDETHLRFYTRSSARALLERGGFRIVRTDATAIPVELALPALGRPPLSGPTRAAALALVRLRPTLFGYQFLFEAVPA